jgi:hypothetical protein
MCWLASSKSRLVIPAVIIVLADGLPAVVKVIAKIADTVVRWPYVLYKIPGVLFPVDQQIIGRRDGGCIPVLSLYEGIFNVLNQNRPYLDLLEANRKDVTRNRSFAAVGVAIVSSRLTLDN